MKSIMPDVVRELLKDIESSLASASHKSVQDVSAEGFSVQVGRDGAALVTVSVCDSSIPSFSATYPTLKIVRGKEEVVETTSEGMRAGGVVWIVRKVFRYGFVPPEGYRKQQANRGRPNQSSQPTSLTRRG